MSLGRASDRRRFAPRDRRAHSDEAAQSEPNGIGKRGPQFEARHAMVLTSRSLRGVRWPKFSHVEEFRQALRTCKRRIVRSFPAEPNTCVSNGRTTPPRLAVEVVRLLSHAVEA
jgi:hypothetical protein